MKDTYFEIESATLVKSVRCPLPFVITGTKLATNIEFAKKDNNLLNKTPLVWLLENHSETLYGVDSPVERDMEMTVLFLDETDVKNYYTKDHRLQVSEPMIALQEEFEKAMLQAQQSSYIADKFTKLDQSLYNQSVYYEANRLAAYYDYESMEFTPEISAALDIYSEESTTLSEKGQMLTIYSESDRIKSILEDLFKEKLDINTNLQMWTRGLCKYGDNFVYLKIDPE